MSIPSGLLRYLRGVVLFPYYSTRSFELLRSIAAEHHKQSPPPKHRQILDDCFLKGATLRDGTLTVDGIRLRLDPPRVIETVNEVLVRRDYAFACDSPYIMIDIGMNVGLAALAHAANPLCHHVYGFEPLKPTFQRALRNIALNSTFADKITPHNCGLSDNTHNLEVRFSLEDIMSVSSEGTFDTCLNGEITHEQITVRRASDALRSILANHHSQQIFLKVDCEGAEYAILPDLAGSGLLDKVHIVIVEWHNKPPDQLLSLLQTHRFFCFTQKIDETWNVGMIKAVRLP